MNDAPKPGPNQPWPEELEHSVLSTSHRSLGRERPQAEDITLSSAWQMLSPEDADAALASNGEGFVYRRDGHPNESSLAKMLTALHGGVDTILTAQGMSAIAAAALHVLKPSAHVWIANELYGKSQKLFLKDLRQWQITTSCFDPTLPRDIERLSNSEVDLVLVETLSNPRLKMPDLHQIADATHANGGLLMVDNTFATHLLCRPLSFGADIVVESLGKIVNGHSDSMLGMLTTQDPVLAKDIRDTVSSFGMASSPLDCYLTQRSLPSLAVRLERACQNASALAEALVQARGVLNVDYPGLTSHPHHALACSQLSGCFGWMLAVHVNAQRDQVMRIFEALRPEIAFVPSLGDVATTVSHPASTSHRTLTDQERAALGISYGTIRISCGLEPTSWLVDKFVSAIPSELH